MVRRYTLKNLIQGVRSMKEKKMQTETQICWFREKNEDQVRPVKVKKHTNRK